MQTTDPDKCPVCGNNIFRQTRILWDEIVTIWGLSKEEEKYINRQQGLQCTRCGSNLRSMTLASAIMNHYKYIGLFPDFCKADMSVLEVNEAGTLSRFVTRFKKYEFAAYPEVDMQDMKYSDESFDIVVHSDTLEHVPDSGLALSECRRVLRTGGIIAYTVPVVYGRMTRKCTPDLKSYHGNPRTRDEDFLVIREYGADFWVELMIAGFRNISIHSISDLSSIAIIGVK